MTTLTLFLKNWWHIITGVTTTVAALTLWIGSWVAQVNAYMVTNRGLSPTEKAAIEETYVRKDVLDPTLLRLEEKIDELQKDMDRLTAKIDYLFRWENIKPEE